MLGVAEDQRALDAQLFHQQNDRVGLLLLGNFAVILGDQFKSGLAIVALDMYGILLEALGNAQDLGGHGGREEQGLAVFGAAVEDIADVVEEAHIEHLVGLVQNDHLDMIHLKGAALDVVNDTAGCTDNDLGLLQAADLDHNGLAAIDGNRLDAFLILGKLAHFVGDLNGQLAGGRQNQDLYAALFGGFGHLDRRDGKSGSLTGAGARLADDIAAFEDDGDDIFLNGGHGLIADIGDGMQDLFGKVQVAEKLFVHCILHKNKSISVSAVWRKVPIHI